MFIRLRNLIHRSCDIVLIIFSEKGFYSFFESIPSFLRIIFLFFSSKFHKIKIIIVLFHSFLKSLIKEYTMFFEYILDFLHCRSSQLQVLFEFLVFVFLKALYKFFLKYLKWILKHKNSIFVIKIVKIPGFNSLWINEWRIFF